jgi:hypothetical protein
MTTSDLTPRYRQFKFKQICHYSVGDSKLKLILEYEANNWENMQIMYLNDSADISMTFTKSETLESDYTKLVYSASKPVIREGKWHYGSYLILVKNPRTDYSKKTKGLCKYKSGIRF